MRDYAPLPRPITRRVELAARSLPRGRRIRPTKEFPFPNVGLDIDAAEALYSSLTMGMSLKETGRFWRNLSIAAMRGDFDYVGQFPFIRRIIKNTGQRRHIPLEVRRAVLAGGVCVFCGTTERLSIDHIVPVSKGGSDDPENLQCACRSCNSRKSNRPTLDAA